MIMLEIMAETGIYVVTGDGNHARGSRNEKKEDRGKMKIAVFV